MPTASADLPDPTTGEVTRQASHALQRLTRSKTARTYLKYSDAWARLRDTHPHIDLGVAVVTDPDTSTEALMGLLSMLACHESVAVPAWSHPNATTLVRAHIATSIAPRTGWTLADLGADGRLFEWVCAVLAHRRSRDEGADPLLTRGRRTGSETFFLRRSLPTPDAVRAARIHAELTTLLAPLSPSARALAVHLGATSAAESDPRQLITAAATAAEGAGGHQR